MLISHDWLRAFVPHGRSAEEIRDLLSAHVATVDRMERLRQDLVDVVVARVVQAGRHPNADTLWVTKVDDGSGDLLDVVCGAPVVTVGTLYPFARVGTTLPGGVKLEKRKIRGEVSSGMLCSARELGLGADHSGIMALDIDVKPGTPFLEAVSVADVRFDIDVLPNRPDLLSHAGVAREVAALTGIPTGVPEELGDLPGLPPGTRVRGEHEAASGGVTIRLEDGEGCPQYMGVVIRGVRVGPSPDWLVRRLESVGLRAISNVVDATNYMLHGFGQPMHAFDLANLADQTVVIRRARGGERMVTLDGVERALDERMTMIADAKTPVAIGGVMGGHDSEVTETTTDLLLEVATFDPARIRVTRRALGLSTDASYRFERGVDGAATATLLELAAGLIMKVAGGSVDGAPILVGREPPPPASVDLRPARAERLLGDGVPAEEMTRLLASVGFAVQPGASGHLRVTPPSWRRDVWRDADLVEEIARLRGYDVLSDTVSPFRPGTVPDHHVHVTGRRVRNALVGEGLAEVRPLPFVRGDDETHVRVTNPLAEDEPHLRRSLLETLARRAEYNLTRMQGDVRLFEIGSAFTPRPDGLPLEAVRVGALIMGRRRPPHFTEPNPPLFDAWDAKALGARIAELAFPGEGAVLEPADDGRSWVIVVGTSRRRVGRAGPVALDRPAWSAEAFGVELTLDPMPNGFVAPRGAHAHDARLEPRHRPSVRYRPLPTTPAAEFDLALLVPDGTAAADVERVLRASGGDLLERVALFDEYRGEGLPSGVRSLAWRLTFRDPVRTLRDKEIEGRRQKILRSLESELGVRPRITA
ncbi:MAG TPA: phenylalanine--tRNA ligase subunit beta [Gemmatimonadaceae bacterium]